jgi:glycosyltransferase involved in cell wall biosynthesis
MDSMATGAGGWGGTTLVDGTVGMISLIVCAHNSASRILPTLHGLERCISEVRQASEVELLVIGNGCEDDTEKVVREFWAGQSIDCSRTYCDEPKLGLTAARLRGFHESKGEILVYCDDDVVPAPGAVLQIARAGELEPQVGGGGGVIHAELLDGSAWPAWFDERLRLFLAVREIPDGPIYSPPNLDGTFYPPGAFVWWRRKAIAAWSDAAGRQSFHLDRRGKQLWSAGDMEINHAVLQSGYQLKHDPQIEAWHRIPPARLQLDYMAALLYWIGRSLQRMNHRHSVSAWKASAAQFLRRARSNPLGLGRAVIDLIRPLSARYSAAGLSEPDISRMLYNLIAIGENDEKLLKFFMPWRH